jgi:hypothetical protein
LYFGLECINRLRAFVCLVVLRDLDFDLVLDLDLGLGVDIAIDLDLGLGVDIAIDLDLGLAVDIAIDLDLGLAVDIATDFDTVSANTNLVFAYSIGDALLRLFKRVRDISASYNT